MPKTKTSKTKRSSKPYSKQSQSTTSKQRRQPRQVRSTNQVSSGAWSEGTLSAQHLAENVAYGAAFLQPDAALKLGGSCDVRIPDNNSAIATSTATISAVANVQLFPGGQANAWPVGATGPTMISAPTMVPMGLAILSYPGSSIDSGSSDGRATLGMYTPIYTDSKGFFVPNPLSIPPGGFSQLSNSYLGFSQSWQPITCNINSLIASYVCSATDTVVGGDGTTRSELQYLTEMTPVAGYTRISLPANPWVSCSVSSYVLPTGSDNPFSTSNTKALFNSIDPDVTANYAGLVPVDPVSNNQTNDYGAGRSISDAAIQVVRFTPDMSQGLGCTVRYFGASEKDLRVAPTLCGIGLCDEDIANIAGQAQVNQLTERLAAMGISLPATATNYPNVPFNASAAIDAVAVAPHGGTCTLTVIVWQPNSGNFDSSTSVVNNVKIETTWVVEFEPDTELVVDRKLAPPIAPEVLHMIRSDGAMSDHCVTTHSFKSFWAKLKSGLKTVARVAGPIVAAIQPELAPFALGAAAVASL